MSNNLIENLEKECEFTSYPQVPKGGQTVSVVRTGVKVKHIPSGITLICECERSQTRNKSLALTMLKTGLREINYYED